MSEDPTEGMDIVNFDPESHEWIAVPPGQPITDQNWLTTITQAPGEPVKRDLVLTYKFDTLLRRLHDMDAARMWGAKRTLKWMVKMLDLQGIELVGIQRQHTPEGLRHYQDQDVK